MIRRDVSRLMDAVVIGLLCGSSALAQGVNQPVAQSQPASVQQDTSSPLPDSPIPNFNPSPVQPLSPPSSESSSSSSSLAQAPPRFWMNSDPNKQVTVLEDTLFRVITDEPLSTQQTRVGASLLFTLSENVVVDGVLIIPRGATVHGTVVESRQAGSLSGSPDLILKLTSLDMAGRSYPLYTYQFKITGASKTKPTETRVKGGAVIGAVVGGAFSGSAKGNTTAAGKLAGMGAGAALGAGVGTMVSAATPGPILTIPAESQMDFYLASPISVVPVSQQEAMRLSHATHSGGPVLYVRGETP